MACIAYTPSRHSKPSFQGRHSALAKIWNRHSTFIPPFMGPISFLWFWLILNHFGNCCILWIAHISVVGASHPFGEMCTPCFQSDFSTMLKMSILIIIVACFGFHLLCLMYRCRSKWQPYCDRCCKRRKQDNMGDVDVGMVPSNNHESKWLSAQWAQVHLFKCSFNVTLYSQDHSLSPANQQVDISVWNQNIMNKAHKK